MSPGEPREGVAGVFRHVFAKRPERAVEQIDIARREGVVGEALFSYDSIADAPALLSALSPAPFPASGAPANPTD